MDVINTQKPEVLMKRHTLLFPYAIVVFGLSFPMPCTADFQVSEDNGGNVKIKINSLTATDDNGIVYDMEHVVADELGELSSFVITSIIVNRKYWDWVPEEGSETIHWW